jgi:hypothetical protein
LIGVSDVSRSTQRPAPAALAGPERRRRSRGGTSAAVLSLQHAAGNAAVGRLVGGAGTLARKEQQQLDTPARRQAAATRYATLLGLKPLQVIARLKEMQQSDLIDLATFAPAPVTDAELRDQRRVMVDMRMYAEREMRDLRGKETALYLRDWPDAEVKAFLADRTLTALRLLDAGVKGEQRLDAKARKRLEGLIEAEQQGGISRGVGVLAGLAPDAAFARIEKLSQRDLEQILAAPIATNEKRTRVSVMLLLERARREEDHETLAKILAAADDDIALAFLARRTPTFLRAIARLGAGKHLSGKDKARILSLIPKALALRVAGQDEKGGLRDLRYLEAAELEAVEDAAGGLSRDQAKAVRARVRRLRDSLQVEQVKGIIDTQVNEWTTGVALGVVTAPLDKGDQETKKWFLIALAGNLVWAGTGFLPQTRLLWLGLKIAGQVGGAVVGSNTAQVVLDKANAVKDASTEFRLRVTDILTAKSKELKKDEKLIERVTDELWQRAETDPNSPAQAIARRTTAWHVIFGGDERTQGDIQRQTVADVEAIWKWFYELWRRNADIYERQTPDERKKTAEYLLDQALVFSGVAAKVGYKAVDRPGPLVEAPTLPTFWP